MSLPATLYRSLLRLTRSDPFTNLSSTVLPPYILNNAQHGPHGLVYSSNASDTATLPLTDVVRLKACIKAAFRLRASQYDLDSDLTNLHIDSAFEALRTLNAVSSQLSYSVSYAKTNIERTRHSAWSVGDVVRVGNERCVVWHVLSREEYDELDPNMAALKALQER